MEQTRSTARARLAIAASLLLVTACSAPRHAVEHAAGRWQVSRTEGGITVLLDSSTGDLWMLESLPGGDGLQWRLMLRAPTAPESTSAASSGAR